MRLACVISLVLAGCKQENAFYEQTGSDTWLQAENDQVDILFVVDDSCSMEDEQATLAAGFQSFAEQLESSQTRFHLGVISTSFDYTDPERGKLLGDPLFLTEEDDYVTEFSSRAQVGIAGLDQEKGLEAASYALGPVANLDLNGGFVRRDARLLVVFVSDEEDCSDGGALAGLDGEECYNQRDQLVPVAEYVEDFRGLKDSLDDVQATAIIGVTGAACQNVYPSTRYKQVAELTGGSVNNICEGDWSAMLTDLGLNATGVLDRFQLSNAAKPETLEVFVDDVPVSESNRNGWTYDPDTWYLTFADLAIPPRGSVVVANYTVQPGQPRPPGAE
ncbi:MAG: hypothetical protein R3F61_28425 [Myxococcota bacterium]